MRSARLLTSGLISFGTLTLASFIIATQVGAASSAASTPKSCLKNVDCLDSSKFCNPITKLCKKKPLMYCKTNARCAKLYGTQYKCNKTTFKCYDKNCSASSAN
ncbi:MAG: hypothetical protein V1926_03980 [Candidatus Peregrinibacteria bacterium]